MYIWNANGFAAKFGRVNLFLLYAGSRHMCKRRDAPSRKQPLRHFLHFSDFPLRSDIPSSINFPDRRGTRWTTSRQLTASTTGSHGFGSMRDMLLGDKLIVFCRHSNALFGIGFIRTGGLRRRQMLSFVCAPSPLSTPMPCNHFPGSHIQSVCQSTEASRVRRCQDGMTPSHPEHSCIQPAAQWERPSQAPRGAPRAISRQPLVTRDANLAFLLRPQRIPTWPFTRLTSSCSPTDITSLAASTAEY